MNQKAAKSLRRMARKLAQEDGNGVRRYRTTLHNPRRVMVGWKPKEVETQDGGVLKPVKSFLSSAWGWLKKMAGREEPAPVQAPIEYEPDIRVVAPETHSLAGGFRFYLQRMKKSWHFVRPLLKLPAQRKLAEVKGLRPDRATMRTLVRQERAEHREQLLALQA